MRVIRVVSVGRRAWADPQALPCSRGRPPASVLLPLPSLSARLIHPSAHPMGYSPCQPKTSFPVSCPTLPQPLSDTLWAL